MGYQWLMDYGWSVVGFTNAAYNPSDYDRVINGLWIMVDPWLGLLMLHTTLLIMMELSMVDGFWLLHG